MENIQDVAVVTAQNAAMQQVSNPANGANAPAASTKSMLEVVQGSDRSQQHKDFGTHFGKKDDTDELLKRVVGQLANLPKWEANLKALETELKQIKAAENFEELKAMYAYLSDEQKAALAAG